MGIAVRDDLRGNGIGTHLVYLAKKTVLNEGKGGLQLTTHVANLRAQTLYESAGFVNCGLCKNGSELFYLWSYRKKDIDELSKK
jgi:ribosomal protein S18 acetylase RimI-like enzyme